jgi:hypothetical protein
MSEVYKVEFYDRLDADGIGAILDHGQAIEVDGTAYVKLPGGYLQPRTDRWHQTPEEAWKSAAVRLDARIARLTQQRDRWQEGRA